MGSKLVGDCTGVKLFRFPPLPRWKSTMKELSSWKQWEPQHFSSFPSGRQESVLLNGYEGAIRNWCKTARTEKGHVSFLLTLPTINVCVNRSHHVIKPIILQLWSKSIAVDNRNVLIALRRKFCISYHWKTETIPT